MGVERILAAGCGGVEVRAGGASADNVMISGHGRLRSISMPCLLFLLIFAGLFISAKASAQATIDISGSISLPAGEVAPAGGISLDIFVGDTFGIGFETTPFTIPAGVNSIDYMITEANSDWIAGYFCNTGCDGYSGKGSYTENGTTSSFDEATILTAGSDYTDIDLVLIEGFPVSGTVSFPDEVVAPAGGQEFVVFGFNENRQDTELYSSIIAEGENSAEFEFILPNDQPDQWLVEYLCPGCEDYVQESFYSDSGTVPFRESATLINSGQSYSDIDGVFIDGNVITGTLSLPEGDTATAEIDFELVATVQNTFGRVIRAGFMDLGESSVEYLLSVPDDPAAQWLVEYVCTRNCDGYMDAAYFSDDGTVFDTSQGTILPGGSDYPGTNLEFLAANTFSGTITFPDGFVAPPGLFFNVNVIDTNQPSGGYFLSVGYSNFSTVGGETEIDYQVKVVDDPGSALVVDISCDDFSSPVGACDTLFPTYYGESASQYNFDDATSLAGGSDQSGIDIEILEADVISGSVILPGTMLAPAGGMDLNVFAGEFSDPFGFGGSMALTIQENAGSADYRFQVPADLPANNWLVQAECELNCDGYERVSYYSVTGSASISEQATLLANDQSHAGINITLAELVPVAPFECEVLVDDFSGQTIDLDNWDQGAFFAGLDGEAVEIGQSIVTNGSGSRSTEQNRFTLGVRGFPDLISADIMLTETILPDTEAGQVFAYAGGSYYYTLDDAANYDDNLGEVFASISIGDRGAGLEAWYHILESSDSNFQAYIVHAEGTLIAPGAVTLNLAYSLSVDYDSATKQFIFGVNDQTASATGPEEGTAIVTDEGLFRGFTAGVSQGEDTDDELISVEASFDNVMTNGELYDDFSGDGLDPAKWYEVFRNRQIVDGKMQTGIVSVTSDQQSIFTYPMSGRFANAECLQADMAIDTTSVVPFNTRVRNRINGYWFNALHNDSGYNGYEGVVYAHIAVEQMEDGRIRAAVYAEQGQDAAYNSGHQLAFYQFETPVVFGQEYRAAIRLDQSDSSLLFRFEDEVFRLPILTPIYPMDPQDNFTGFTTRTQSGPGTIQATVDNVYATPAEMEVVSEEICFPIVGQTGAAVICL